MGKAIEKIALKRGHEIVSKIDKGYNQGNINQADVAINFSIPAAAVNNITIALESKIPVVCGTTGWLEHYKKVTQIASYNDTVTAVRLSVISCQQALLRLIQSVWSICDPNKLFDVVCCFGRMLVEHER